MIGTTISHYRVLRELGRGGMGVVYLAEDTRLGRKVAIKTLPPEMARDPVRRKRFELEARAAAALSHSGIAQVHQLEEQGEDLYIVFEYVEGRDLRGIVLQGGAPREELFKIASGIARALSVAHAQGIVHRDLKPENVLLTASGETKILDFGLARFENSALDTATISIALTTAGTIVGTVGYMSPEQLECKEVDFRSDIFSFGVMLYELACGTHPFQGGSAASTIANVLNQQPPPLTSANPIMPPELEWIVSKCLRKKREERYQSTRDLLVDLENLERGPREQMVTAPALSRRWWFIHHAATMFVTTPGVIFLLVAAGPAIPSSFRMPLIFLQVFAVALNWSLRFVLLNAALGNPKTLAAEALRLRPWIKWTGWLIILGLIATAFSIANIKDVLATIIASLAMGGVVSVLFLEPATARAAFGEPSEKPISSSVDRRN